MNFLECNAFDDLKKYVFNALKIGEIFGERYLVTRKHRICHNSIELFDLLKCEFKYMTLLDFIELVNHLDSRMSKDIIHIDFL